jgi:DNA helicase-2/ATP-dependent DNA helicase PcrA
MNNSLVIAAAGSGKTTYLVEQALAVPSTESVLITTYTEANERQIRDRFIKAIGYIPAHITILTWFSLLLQHGVRPFQSILNDSVHTKTIGFYLTNKRSGQKFGYDGNPLLVAGKPVYWGEADFKHHYFTADFRIFSDKISKFVINTNEKSKGLVISRLIKMFNHIFIDEVQDLAGYDLELIKLLFQFAQRVLLVGDPRQVTYATHQSAKYSKYTDGKIKEFILNELGKKIKCEVDEVSLARSHRNNSSICKFSSKLYLDLPVTLPCECKVCRQESPHMGVFVVRPNQVSNYLKLFAPLQLRWSSSAKVAAEYPAMNMGESKGLTVERTLIYPTKDMQQWVKNSNVKLKNEARAKFYVAVTRAKISTAIILDYQEGEVIEDVQKYID